jgi:hypothetical protein
VYDRDQWIGDIDVLPLFKQDNDAIRRNTITCRGCSLGQKTHDIPNWLVAIDNWEELLDAPKDLGKLNVAVFRAYDNWIARLAAACICVQKGFRIVINPAEKVCWGCCCRKKWGWSKETMSRSRYAAQDYDYIDPSIDEDDCDVGAGDCSSDSSDSEDLDTLDSPEEPILEAPDDTFSDHWNDQASRTATHTRYTVPVQEKLREINLDPGYESDDTVFHDEWELLLQHLPQIFIL